MNKKNEVKFLYLSQEDMIEAGVLNMEKCVNTIEEGFELLSKGDCLSGGPGEHDHGLRIWFPAKARGKNMPILGPDRRFMAMVGYLGGRFNVCGAKWYGSNIKNREERGLPRSILLTILNDPVSGAPLAIMDGTLISSMRTGAVPGVAAKYLAKKDSNTLGIVGAGIISRTCFMSIASVLPNLKEVKVFDINESQSEKFCEFIKSKTNIKKAYSVDNLEESINNSDVISIAAAGKKLPLVKDEWFKKGSCLILTGGIQHIENLYLNSNIVVDDWKMQIRWAIENDERKGIEPLDDTFEELAAIYLKRLIDEGKLKENEIVDIGDIITGKKVGRKDDFQKYLFISGGLPMEDLSWGYEIYKNAVKNGIGKELELWKEPYSI